jgi:hypothetical protein
MVATLTLDCYALIFLITAVVAVRWIDRHDPALRKDGSPSRESA